MSTAKEAFIHPLADVKTSHVGAGTTIWQYVVALPEAVIGVECNICSHCFIESDVIIGDRVTVKNGVQLWDGLRVGDDVFIGPNVTFTNDRFPRSKQHPEAFLATLIEPSVSIGGGATILPGLKIGRSAMVGSGAVVTRSVPPNAIVVGNPARIVGYVDARGIKASAAGAVKADVSGNDESWAVKLHELPRVSDIRGNLTVGEFDRTIPFNAKRYFMVFDVPSVETRGEHAHRECHQFLVCVRGSVSVVADDGHIRREFRLDRPDLGLHLPPLVWGIQYRYSADALLLVFASHYYDAGDYIRDYDEFLAIAGTRR